MLHTTGKLSSTSRPFLHLLGKKKKKKNEITEVDYIFRQENFGSDVRILTHFTNCTSVISGGKAKLCIVVFLAKNRLWTVLVLVCEFSSYIVHIFLHIQFRPSQTAQVNIEH